MDPMPRPRPPHLHRQITRHGATVWYVRKGKGPRTRIRAGYGTDEFWKEYRAAVEGTPAPAKATPARMTFSWALDRYRASSAWSGLAAATRRQRENIYRAIAEAAGLEPLSAFTPEAIIAGRERRAAKPHAANNFLKAMRGFFGWAAGDGGLIDTDPTKGVALLRGRNDDVGFHTWTEAELARFEAKWPLGTRERLAFDILLYTGLRRGDAVVLGRQHIRDGLITIRAEKTGEEVFIPVQPELAASIAATTTGDLTLLVTQSGQRFVKESFGNWFREACRDAGCPGSAHGLRKAGAVRAAEAGASNQELMALYGWSTGKMADHYTRAASRKRLAKAAGERLRNADAPHRNQGEGSKAKKLTNSDS